ncbi:hypothetical protein MKK88_31240 [Methylobacterium sp. E-005]|uniref:hypothetical protein n=1 Tax=Methylobacterium sp. E-005 TaxID=2836549 RepID=UPI001FBB5DFF|nr:hypothetical protein [Methylobacterium sp. E-005]MCJ2090422.1 hypothetical protein [Methylobacterium sp. E-005]
MQGGATATEFWDVAGYSTKTSAITMSAADLVDAAMAGLDQGELVTIPGLQDAADWTRLGEGRRAIAAKFNNAKPSARQALGALRAHDGERCLNLGEHPCRTFSST